MSIISIGSSNYDNICVGQISGEYKYYTQTQPNVSFLVGNNEYIVTIRDRIVSLEDQVRELKKETFILKLEKYFRQDIIWKYYS